jgi:hypothetical protein
MKMTRAASVVLLLLSAACSPTGRGGGSGADGGPGAFTSPEDLAATLVPPHDVDLRWRNDARELGGVFVEFATDPNGDFTMLAQLWPETAQFRHKDLAPETTYVYRIRPFFGAPSPVVTVTTGPRPAPGTREPVEGPLDEGRTSSGGKSLRAPESMADAAPAGLIAILSSPTAVDLRWMDRASDEDGYLVEIAPDPVGPFRLGGLLPADVTSFRKTQLPPEQRASFRVRAFRYGAPSNVASVTLPR